MDPTERVAKAIADALDEQKSIDLPDRYAEWIDVGELAQAAIDALQLTEETRREEVDTGRWGTEVRLVGPWVEGER